MTPLCLALAALAAPAPVPDDSSVLDRVAVLGASVTAGYGLRDELEVDVGLADVLSAACPGVDFAAHGDVFFYLDPPAVGRRLADEAAAGDPTLVVAVDFLFWYAHDYEVLRDGAEGRLAGLEEGLALLDRFECPILVGDVPDVSISLEGHGPFGVPMIPAAAIPDDATRARLNARIRAWADERERATVVSLEGFLGRVARGEPFEVRGNRIPADARDELLQEDLLHPSLAGYLALAVVVLDELERAHPDPALEAVHWSVADLEEAVLAATHDAREEARARERAREERRRRREERRRERESAETAGAGSGR